MWEYWENWASRILCDKAVFTFIWYAINQSHIYTFLQQKTDHKDKNCLPQSKLPNIMPTAKEALHRQVASIAIKEKKTLPDMCHVVQQQWGTLTIQNILTRPNALIWHFWQGKNVKHVLERMTALHTKTHSTFQNTLGHQKG